jgi:polysaccharide pyruvyl transferase WcaK-like protein
MRIGILTYHYSINEGAMLQAYALLHACREVFQGHSVELINYEPIRHAFRDFTHVFYRPVSYARFAREFRRWRRLREFKYQKLISPDSASCSSDSLEQAVRFLNHQNYDAILVGSDEVWKVSSQTSRTFPNLYWLPGVLKARRFSYAASAHKSDLGQLSQETRETLKACLERFEKISVRDASTEAFVKECLEANTPVWRVADPTFLVDAFVSDPIEPIRHFKQMGWRTVAISSHAREADVNLADELDPLVWTQIYRHCHFCVTQRFHGAVFAIRSELPFVAVDWHATEHGTSKIQDLLATMGLANHCVPKATLFNSDLLETRIAEAMRSTDFTIARQVKQKAKEDGLLFLREIANALA